MERSGTSKSPLFSRELAPDSGSSCLGNASKVQPGSVSDVGN